MKSMLRVPSSLVGTGDAKADADDKSANRNREGERERLISKATVAFMKHACKQTCKIMITVRMRGQEQA